MLFSSKFINFLGSDYGCFPIRACARIAVCLWAMKYELCMKYGKIFVM